MISDDEPAIYDYVSTVTDGESNSSRYEMKTYINSAVDTKMINI